MTLELIQRLLSQTWAIHPDWFDTICAIIDERVQHGKPDAHMIRERISGPPSFGRNSQHPAHPSDIAVMNVFGPILPRAGGISEVSGPVTSHHEIAKQLRALADNPNVTSIVLNVDSPGGSTNGISTSVEAVRYARERKPVVAIANEQMCSAAYWIASQASHIIAARSSDVGSIGVMARVTERTKQNAAHGVTHRIFRSTPLKGIGNADEPLTDDAAVELQRLVNETHAMFVSDVAKGRNVSLRTAEAWGDARIHTGEASKRLGLVDQIGTLEDAISVAHAMTQNALIPQRKGETMTENATITYVPSPATTTTAQPKGDRMTVDERLTAFKQADPELYDHIVQQASAANREAMDALRALQAEIAAERAARAKQQRTILATNMLTAAKLPPLGSVNDIDLDADFAARVEQTAQAADTEEEAITALEAMLTVEKARRSIATPAGRQNTVPIPNAQPAFLKPAAAAEHSTATLDALRSLRLG